ncbi:tetratricopeptide repeat protein [Micromonospora sagamiensis]|uniref:Tetratricopeptide repeat protein n=1 Tax=Micromonospora sagamiensis TaxID=47875 RepID=A0A562WA31_9ACTN|nr:hypothetical protein [Micromonospora sagamiensis]TWJ27143.1 hypothetical protein JD81_00630 [Micromonospora sagamiensis]BCL13963.1 hypothetical protein GCM10017556_17020 [Micromonospora sagamiensis]
MEEDHQGDLGQWQLVSLVTCLRQTLLEIASMGSATDKKTKSRRLGGPSPLDIIDELTARGLDGESLVRYGIAPEMILHALVDLLVAELLSAGAADTPSASNGWRRVFKIDDPRVQARVPRLLRDQKDVQNAVQGLVENGDGVLGPTLAAAALWACNAGLESLLTFSPPTEEQLAEANLSPSLDLDLMRDYKWAVDRFSSTYYFEWAIGSLHSEWRWQHGIGIPPCPAHLMQHPPVQLDLLNHQIAQRAVLSNSSEIIPSLSQQVGRHALSLLRDGKHEHAATLFEFVCHQEPDNPEPHNNLGFCLLPSAPRLALTHLGIARRLGYEPLAINVYNVMCCHVALGQNQEAVKEADRYLSSGTQKPLTSATLWTVSPSGDFSLWETDDVHEAVSDLAAHAAAVVPRPRMIGGDPRGHIVDDAPRST